MTTRPPSLRARQGFGSIVLVATMTVLIVGLTLASYTAAHLRFAANSERSATSERTTNRLYDTAAWLHSFDGATTLGGDATRLALLQQAPVRRCLLLDYSAGALRSKQVRLGPTEAPTGVCGTSERHVLHATAAPTTFVWRDAAGSLASPSAAKTVEFTLADAAAPSVRPVVVKLRVND